MKYFQFILSYGSTNETLTHDPEGWDKIGLAFMRSESYHGILRSMAVNSLRFPRKAGLGGDTIKTLYDTYGLNADITITINIKNPQTNGWVLFFQGKIHIDPTQFKIERDFVEVDIIDSAKLQRFRSNDEIEFDLNSLVALNGNSITAFQDSPKTVTFPPVDIYLAVDMRMNCFSGTLYSFKLEDADYSNQYGYTFAFETDIELNELQEALIIARLPAGRQLKVYENIKDQTAYLKITEVFIPFSNTMLHTASTNGAGSFYNAEFSLYFQIYNSSDVIQHNVKLGTKSWNNVYESNVPFQFSYNIPYNTYYAVPVGGYAGFVLVYSTTSFFHTYTTISGSLNLDIKFHEKTDGYEETTGLAFLPYEAFTRLLQLTTGETDTSKLLYSELFGRTDSEFQTYSVNGEGSLDALITGYNIRGYTDKAFNVKFKDIFKNYDCIRNIGMGFDKTNDRFFIEKKEEFFKDSLMFDLGEVSELTITPYKESFFNMIDSGYDDDGKYEDYGGVNEFNVRTNHAVDLPVKNTLNLRSPFNASSIAIELTRRYHKRKYSSLDTKKDNTIFVINTDGSEAIQGGSDISGYLGANQTYNITLAPRENLIRWGNFLRAGQWKNGTIKIRFISSNKTSITYRNQNGDVVDEFDDIAVSELPDLRLFNPEYYEFKSIINTEILNQLNSDPHGFIRFSFDSEYFEGYLDEAQTEEYNELATYKLIARDKTAFVQKLFEDSVIANFEDDYKHYLE